MEQKRVGRQTVRLETAPAVVSWANIGGKMEGAGPLAAHFDELDDDPFFGRKTWEQGESAMQSRVFRRALSKGGLTAADLDYVFAADLPSKLRSRFRVGKVARPSSSKPLRRRRSKPLPNHRPAPARRMPGWPRILSSS